MNAKYLAVIQKAGELLSDPARRCVGTLAVNTKQSPVDPTSKKACRWCLTGALYKSCCELGVKSTQDWFAIYDLVKDQTGIPKEVPAPVFWDLNEDMHDLIVERMVKAT